MKTESNIPSDGRSAIPPVVMPKNEGALEVESSSAPTTILPATGGGEKNNKIAQSVKASKGKGQDATFLLPNGMVGKPYAQIILDISELGDQIEDVGIDDLDKFGMSFSPSKLAFEGTPSLAGDHALTVRYTVLESEKCPFCFKSISAHFHHLPPKRENKTLTLKWLVNADPQSLWLNLPSDPSGIYAKPDSAIGATAAGERKIVAASQRGRSHAHVGSSRDDAFRINYNAETKTAYILVADGAGSSKYSRKGSEVACDTALRVMEDKMTADFWTKILPYIVASRTKTDVAAAHQVQAMLYPSLGDAAFEANKAISSESKTQAGSTPKDFATTLLVAVCKRLDDGWFIAGYWVGDGGLGIYDEKHGVRLLGAPDGGEFAGQTRFLTMAEVFASGAEVSRRIRFETVEDFTAVVVMSDGVTDPKFQTDNNLNRKEKWDELWAEIQPVLSGDGTGDEIAQRLLNWLDFWSPGNHDDRTIVVMA